MIGLEEALKPLRRRMKLQRTVEWLAIGLCVGMICVLLLRAASFLWPFDAVWPWSLGALFAAPLLFGLVSWLWPVPAMDAARRVDSLGLEARAQTALMLLDSDSPMAELQRKDALFHLNRLKPAQLFPLKFPRYALAGMAVCLVLFGFSFFIPNPQQVVLEARASFQREMEKQADLVDEGAVKLDAKKAETPELRKVLGDLSLELRKAQEPRTALTAVDEAQRKIEAMEALARKENLSALEENNLGELSKALESEEQLRKWLEGQSPSAASETLQRAAASMGKGEAADGMKAAADAVAQGNLSQALSQLQAVATGQSSATQMAAALSDMARIAAANAGARQAALAASSSGSGAEAGASGQGASGGSQGQGSGAGAGQGSSDQDGGYREASGQAGSGASQGQGELKVQAYEAIYDPTRLGRSGEAVAAPGKVNEGEISETEAGVGLGSVQESVPYRQALDDYEAAAVTAAQNAQLPAYAQKWVQDYFNALAR